MSEKGTERLSASDETEEKTQALLEDEDYLIDVELSKGNRKTIDVKYLLMLKTELTYNKSDAELEDALNRVDPYLFVFKRAAEYWGNDLAEHDIRYDIWQKKAWKETEEKLIRAELKKVEDGTITKSKMNVTKAHVDASLMEEQEEKYSEYNNILRAKRSRLTFIQDLVKILESRGSRLQTIVNSRRGRQ